MRKNKIIIIIVSKFQNVQGPCTGTPPPSPTMNRIIDKMTRLKTLPFHNTSPNLRAHCISYLTWNSDRTVPLMLPPGFTFTYDLCRVAVFDAPLTETVNSTATRRIWRRHSMVVSVNSQKLGYILHENVLTPFTTHQALVFNLCQFRQLYVSGVSNMLLLYILNLHWNIFFQCLLSAIDL